jgi:hypothetical protein
MERQLKEICQENPNPIRTLVKAYPNTTPKGGASKSKLSHRAF